MLELTVLHAMRMKGRLTPAVAATCAGVPLPDAQVQLDRLVAAGLASQAGAAVRITPAGRDRLTELSDEERGQVDQAVLGAAYEDFDRVNTELKATITSWQLRDEQTPNDHSDPSYDAAVIERLSALHENFEPLLERLVAAVPRLAPYLGRFRAALAEIAGGDHGFVARPIADSYHTIWFELHEELIALLGRSRADEAAAGRAG